MNAETFYERHAIDPKVASKVGVREIPQGLSFPYRASDGTSYERTRSLSHKATWQPAGQRLTLWWPYRPQDPRAVLLCEGESDTLAALSALRSRRLVPVGIPGTGMSGERIAVELLDAGLRHVFLGLDNDPAGQKAQERIALALLRAGLRVWEVPIPKDKDISECLASLGPGWLNTSMRASTDAMTPSRRAQLYLALPQPRPPSRRRIRTFDNALKEIPTAEWIHALTGQVPDNRGNITCPFPDHEDKSPSMRVYPGDKGVWCFSCYRGGDIYAFAQELWGVDFKRAKERLEEIFHANDQPALGNTRAA